MYGIPTSTLNDRVLQKTSLVSNTLCRSTEIPIELEKQLAAGLRAMQRWGWGLSREEVLDKPTWKLRLQRADLDRTDLSLFESATICQLKTSICGV